MIYVIATLTIKPGAFQNVMASALPFVEATRKEVGCLSFDMHRSMTAEDTFVFVERWRDMDALTAHFESDSLKIWRDSGQRYLEDTKIEIITPENVEKR